MFKKLFLIVFLLGSAALLAFSGPAYHNVRIDGTNGYIFYVVADTADTGSNGVARQDDTMLSDTLSIVFLDQFNVVDSAYRYANIAIKLSAIDTGSILASENDTVQDTFIVYTISKYAGCEWTVYADTFTKINDSAIHNFILDTMAYTELYWKTIYWDSLTPTSVDTNSYTFTINVLLGGIR